MPTPPRDFYLDPQTFDLVLDDDRQAVTIEGAGAIAQRVRVAFECQAGTYDLDLELGMDYLGVLFQRGATDDQIAAAFRRTVFALDADEHISRVRVERIARLPQTRSATIYATIYTPWGDAPISVVVGLP